MKLYTKEGLIKELRRIYAAGWHRSVKRTINTRNDGAVGNTLEVLLGISENNIPLPNASEWELKGQRSQSTSLVTLKHIEPSPRAARIVSALLLPKYGWKHKQAGGRYPVTEMSFRSTTSSTEYTKRGFRIIVDRNAGKLRFVFNPAVADRGDPEIATWLGMVGKRVGLGPFEPEPYWGFDDLQYEIGAKISNCFYAVADTKVMNEREYFLYEKLYILSGFSFDKFLGCLDQGVVVVDFDARTGHNHGTKFRIKQGHWTNLYSSVQEAI